MSDFITARLTEADIALLEMAATRGVQYLPYEAEEQDED